MHSPLSFWFLSYFVGFYVVCLDARFSLPQSGLHLASKCNYGRLFNRFSVSLEAVSSCSKVYCVGRGSLEEREVICWDSLITTPCLLNQRRFLCMKAPSDFILFMNLTCEKSLKVYIFSLLMCFPFTWLLTSGLPIIFWKSLLFTDSCVFTVYTVSH